MTKNLFVSRLPYLDVLRIAATVAVVLIHVCTPLVTAFGNIPESSWWLGHIFDSLSRWAVPVFVMISGAVLLDSDHLEQAALKSRTRSPLSPLSLEALWQFFTKRFWRLAVPLFGWTVLYGWYYHLFRGDPLSLSFSLRRIIFDQPYEHLYFLWLLLELAIITPWLKFLIKEITLSSTAFLTGLFFFITLFWTPLRLLFPFFIPYIGYYLAGYVLKKVQVQNSAHISLITGATFLAAMTIIFGTWLTFTGHIQLKDPLLFYDYTKALVVLMSLGVFVLVKHICQDASVARVLHRHSMILGLLSSVTFGVYLIHPVVIDVLNHGAGISVMSGTYTLLRIVSVLFATLLLSGLLSYGIELVTQRVRRFFSGTRYQLKDPHAQFPYTHKR